MNTNHSSKTDDTRCGDISCSETPLAPPTTDRAELTRSSIDTHVNGIPKAADGSEAIANEHSNQNAATTEAATTSQDSFTKGVPAQNPVFSHPVAALYGGESREKAVDSDASLSKKAESWTQTLPRPIKNLREMGITRKTLDSFKIQNVYAIGFMYPVYDINGIQSLTCMLGVFLEPQRISWVPNPSGDSEETQFYNLKSLRGLSSQQKTLYVVPQDYDVWVAEQNGLPAISCIGQFNYVRFADLMLEHKIKSVTAIFENTLEGRHNALKMYDAVQGKISVSLRLLDGPFGASIAELFKWTDFKAEDFRNEIDMLPELSPVLFNAWRQRPQGMLKGLPEIECDTLLPCYSVDELAQLPRPQCLIEDTLLSNGVTLLTGRHASGKSFVALDMALSISQGHPWQGKKTQSGAAFYFSGEGIEGFFSRICAWKQAHGVGEEPNFAVVTEGAYIVDPAVRRRVIDTVRAQLKKMNLAPDGAALLVFDTLARYRGALNDNDSNDMSQVMDALEEIGRELGAAVLLVHHNNRDDTYRGSSVLPANATGHLEISNPPSKSQGQKIKIRVAKLKDYPQGHSLNLGSQVVEIGGVDEFGKPLSSLVLVLDKSAATKGEQLSPKENDALQALVQLSDVGATSTVWKKAAVAKGVSSTTFDRAKTKLLDEHAVECDNSGASGALFKAVEGWSGSPAENDAENEDDAPLVPYHYQLQEGDPEVDEDYPIGEWLVRYRRES